MPSEESRIFRYLDPSRTLRVTNKAVWKQLAEKGYV
jgi:hypothetical protein